MFVIGITGSSGSGKTSVCQIIDKLANAKVIDADKVVRQLQDDKTEYYEKIVETFGNKILTENDLIDRKKLANIIFSDEIEKEKLNLLTKKYVVEEIQRRVESLKNENVDYIVVDAPTLIESNMMDMFDKIIVVLSKTENKIKRICERDNITEEIARKRLMIQQDDEFYKAHSDFYITNDDENLESKVRNILEQLEREKI